MRYFSFGLFALVLLHPVAETTIDPDRAVPRFIQRGKWICVNKFAATETARLRAAWPATSAVPTGIDAAFSVCFAKLRQQRGVNHKLLP